MLASRLRKHGMSVAVLECGPLTPNEDPNPLNTVELTGQNYEGATRGRSRGLGGNSGRWGGQLFPMRAEALAPRPSLHTPGWPLDWAGLVKYLPEIETLFGIPQGAL